MPFVDVPVSERGDPWFEDGNVVILADGAVTAFKVHRGVLSRYSAVFESMFQLPQPDSLADVESVEGCPLVRMFDLPWDLSVLIKALYDGVTFGDRTTDDFFYLASVLRLSTKYDIHHLREACISHLKMTWSSTLTGHDAMVSLALSSPHHNNLTYPYVHPIHVLNVAREANVSIIIPSVMLFLSCYPLNDLLRADHPKLNVEHPSKPSSQLTVADMKDYALMYQYRIDILLDFMRNFTGKRTASPGCLRTEATQHRTNACTKAFMHLSSRLSRSWTSRTGPLYFMLQAVRELHPGTDGIEVCAVCRKAYANDVEKLRRELWQKLPTVIGMPEWEAIDATTEGVAVEGFP